jgi:hypothetical protein
MKRISLRLFFALLTFVIGISFTTFWIFKSEIPDASLPKINLPQNPQQYVSEVDAKIDTVDLQLEWRAMLLRRFRETRLIQSPANIDESYRLIWVPTFDEPTIIRIWRSKENYFIVTKRLKRNRNNLEIGNLKFEKTRSLTAEEWRNFTSLIQQRGFWSMPSNIKEPLVEDGASWTLEGINNGQYHLVNRTLPSAQISEIFRELFRLTGIEIEYEGYL